MQRLAERKDIKCGGAAGGEHGREEAVEGVKAWSSEGW